MKIFHLKSQATKYRAIHTNSACCLPLKHLFMSLFMSVFHLFAVKKEVKKKDAE